MVSIKRIIFLMFFYASNFKSYGQNIEQRVIGPSPDAAALGKYGDIPVSTYTGIPDIQIPLYDIAFRDIHLPISLSYHASGVQVEEESGWVGLGWALNAGGVITRSIRSGDDLTRIRNTDQLPMSIFNFKGFQYDPAIPDPVSQSYLSDVCYNNVDPEPDKFYFNFLGTAGSFILEKGQNTAEDNIVGTSLTASKINIKYIKSTKQWVIITTDGFTYYFGTKEYQEVRKTEQTKYTGNEFASESSLEPYFYFYRNDDFNISSWYLDKIVSPLGAVVNYVYDLNTFTNGMPDAQESLYGSVKDNFTDQWSHVVDIINPSGSTSCYADALGDKRQRFGNQTITAHIYLKEIQSDLGKVIFTKSAREDILAANTLSADPWGVTFLQYAVGSINSNSKGPQKLDNFIVQDYNGKTIKKVEFNYSYFNNNYTQSAKYLYERLKLNGVRECDGSSNCKPYYNFTYDEINPLPSKYSHAIDFWGYYNGATANPTRIPYGTYQNTSTSIISHLGDADRQPNASYMKSGILTKIIYPTGGSTEFEYEPNDYYYFGSSAFTLTDFENNLGNTIHPRVVSADPYSVYKKTGGGLRIKRITSKDGVSATSNIKRYDYTVTDGNNVKKSTGRLMMFPMNHYTQHTFYSSGNCYADVVTMYAKSWSCVPLGNSASGSIVGYDKITVYEGENGENGRTEYSYLNDVEDLQQNATIYIAGLPNIVHTSNGLLTDKIIYDASGNQLQNLHNTYTQQLVKNIRSLGYEQSIFGTGFYVNGVFYNGDCLQPQANQPYNVISDRYVLSQEDVKSYPSANTLYTETVKNFTYNTSTHLQLTTEETYNSKNNLIRNEIKYPIDFSTDPIYGEMVNRNIIAPIETIRTNVTSGTSVSKLKSNYQLLVPLNTPVPLNVQTSTGGNAYQTKLTINTYDANKNVLQTIDKSGTVKAYLWDYKSSYAVAEVTGSNNIYNTIPATLTTNGVAVYANAAPVTVNVQPTTTGKINIKISSNPNYTYTTGLTLKRLTDNVYFSLTATSVTNDNNNSEVYSSSVNNLSPGTYAVTATTGSNNTSSSVTMTIDYPGYQTTSEMAYTSFETDSKGGWNYTGNITNYPTTPTGEKCFNLFQQNGNITKTVTSSNTYIVSYWSTNTNGINIQGTVSAYPVKGKTINGWTYMEHKITGVNLITITGTGLIDELRLYPANAQMNTFTFKPLIGMTGQCDVNNKITSYTYDNFNRLRAVKDQDGNVIKKICYNYTGQQVDCGIFYNQAQSKSFLKNDCSSNLGGTEVVYTVQGDKYQSTASQAAADALATQEINTYGQSNANLNGTCLATVSILSNNYDLNPDISVIYINVVDNTKQYTFSIPSLNPVQTATLSPNIPQGTYNITFHNNGPVPHQAVQYTIGPGANSFSKNTNATNTTINNVVVTSTICNQISIGIPTLEQ